MTAPPPLPVLITGASAGIGAEFARLCAQKGHRLALVARNQDALERLSIELGTPGGAKPVIVALDLSLPDSPARLTGALEVAGFEPGILVNNAGYGLTGRALDLDPGGQIGIIDLNIRALTEVTLCFLPAIKRAHGRILNVASTAAFLPGPGMAVYYASKAYVLSFSQALAHELAPHNVSVTALCPGVTATGFALRAEGKPVNLNSYAVMSAQDVARAGYAGMMAGKRIIVPGILNRILTGLMPFVPRVVLLPMIARLKLGRKQAQNSSDG